MTVVEARLPLARTRVADLVELTKPRITLMILFTVLLGFYLGAEGTLTLTLLPALIGTALITSGTAALNQYLERHLDGLMRRTESRPLPSGRLRPREALVFGLALCVSGFLLLTIMVNPLTGGLAAATTVSYIFIYTPLKRVTSLSTIVGAIPGALPPVGGWTAATGRLEPEAAVLFAIVFLWQLPHFLAISWLYRDDYARGGLRMLSVADKDGRATARQVLIYSLALLPVSLLPAAIGLGGPIYTTGAIVLGALFVGTGLHFSLTRSLLHARRLLLTSVAYLPLLASLLMLDRGVS